MGVCTPGLHTQKGHFSDLGVCPHPHTPPLDPSLPYTSVTLLQGDQAADDNFLINYLFNY